MREIIGCQPDLRDVGQKTEKKMKSPYANEHKAKWIKFRNMDGVDVFVCNLSQCWKQILTRLR